MGRDKDDAERRDQAQYDMAERADRRCLFCNSVIPYGTNRGPHGECPACVGSLKDD